MYSEVRSSLVSKGISEFTVAQTSPNAVSPCETFQRLHGPRPSQFAATMPTRRKVYTHSTYVSFPSPPFSCWLPHIPLTSDASSPSAQCYFLNFGNADIPVLYSVQRLRDGRSYATRTVLATQAGTPIFTLTCSFSLPEPKQPVRELGLPRWPLKYVRTEEEDKERLGEKIPEPEECESTEEVLKKALGMAGTLPTKLKD